MPRSPRTPSSPPPSSVPAVGRRDFVAGGTGLFCSLLAARGVDHLSRHDVARVDAAASRAKRPRPRRRPGDPVDRLRFSTPKPQPGGRVVEYWLEARSRTWDIAPLGHDEWMGHRVRGKRTFRAFTYQPFEPGFAAPAGHAGMPGPTLHAEVGDTVVVHLRNADEHFGQAITLHSHGVRYNPEYDGTYLGNFTRAGGFVPPGEEFTYTWEATPDSVGAWPYHDHGPNHTLNTMRGLFGAIVIRPRGAKRPDREYALFMHSLPPQITGRQDLVQCFNGRTGAGNTPTLRAKVGEDVAMHVFGGDGMFHTFHIHGHRWPDHAGVSVDSPTVGPNESITARFVEDNPGRWLYHCHVFSHQDAGMAGWYLVDR